MGLFHNLLLLGVKPQNALEEAFLAFLKGRMEAPQFEARLRRARVTVLVPERPDAGAPLRPLIMEGTAGQPALCVFTAPARATALRKSAPAFDHALETEFSFVLSVTPPGVGMVFNAGSLFSTELPPEGVDALRAG